MQDKIEYLSQYRHLRRECQQLREMIERLTSRAEPHGAPLTGMPRSGSARDVVGDMAAELADLRAELAERELCAVRAVRRIERWIDAVPGARDRNILRWRYINGWSWLRIGMAMECDETTARRWHLDFLRASPPIPENQDEMC